MPDLFALLPPLQRVDHPLLAGRTITAIGVSAILYDETDYYFEVNRPRYWGQRADGVLSIGIGGIGGKIEPDEGLLAALRREVQEELGARLRLDESERTALIDNWQWAGWLDLPFNRKYPAPYLLNLLPPRLGGPDTPDALVIVTYQAQLRDRPARGDLFGLLTVARPALRALFARPEWPVDELLAHPDVSLDLAEPLPAGALLRPILTARALSVLLQQTVDGRR